MTSATSAKERGLESLLCEIVGSSSSQFLSLSLSAACSGKGVVQNKATMTVAGAGIWTHYHLACMFTAAPSADGERFPTVLKKKVVALL